MIVEVAVPIPFSEPFDYLVPDELCDRVEQGCRVLVPVASRSIIGTVVTKKETTSFEKLKSISLLIDKKPIFSLQSINLAKWIADYYLCSLGSVFEIALPRGLKPQIREVFTATDDKNIKDSFSNCEKELLDHLVGKQISIIKKPKYKDILDLIEKWRQQKTLNSEKRAVYRYEPFESIEWVQVNQTDGKIKLKSGSKPEQLVALLHEKGRIRLTELKKIIPGSASTIRNLEKRGIIKREMLRDKNANDEKSIYQDQFLELNEDQQKAVKKIDQSFSTNSYQTFLLFGVTGSGKTEVYLHTVKACLQKGKGALVLIPEISLTPQAVSRFKERFGERIAVLHSGMVDKERARQWWKIKKGQADVIIGARSAIFAPLENIGLIIVDEEHDSSYKQQETPFYNARDVAVKLGSMSNAIVILGSATPAIESYQNAITGKYELLTLPSRVNQKPMPAADVINLKDTKRHSGAFYLSKPLVALLKEQYELNKQALVFLNRRGFASFLSCKECETPVLCRNCSIAMTWHKTRNQLVCHYCGHHQKYPKNCQHCNHQYFRMEGIGTQRIEKDLQRIFPEARFLRMDRDTIQKRGSLEDNIDKINNREVDFIIGTQLISKGHDFKHIGIVCIVLADMSLNIPDFRSSERSYQLISQVSGRAGRDEDGEGIALVQTYNPDHFAIQAAITNDYLSFFENEVVAREALQNPPFLRSILLKVSSEVEKKAELSAKSLADVISKYASDCNIQMLGPIEAPIKKVNNRFYWQILLKGTQLGNMKKRLQQIIWKGKDWKPASAARVSIDVDPYMLL